MNQDEFEKMIAELEETCQERAAKIDKLNDEMARMSAVLEAARQTAAILEAAASEDEPPSEEECGQFYDELRECMDRICDSVFELDTSENKSAFAEQQKLLKLCMQSNEDMINALEAILDLDQLEGIHALVRDVLGDETEEDPEDKPF